MQAKVAGWVLCFRQVTPVVLLGRLASSTEALELLVYIHFHTLRELLLLGINLLRLRNLGVGTLPESVSTQ